MLTRAKNRSAIEAAVASTSDLSLHPVYLDLPEAARRWKHGRRGLHAYYLIWQALAWRTARRLHQTVGFDVAHHLTFAVDWMPAGVAWVRDLPLVWGPVGGTTGVPWRLWRWLGWRGVIEEGLREVETRLARRCFGDATARRAAIVVCQNRDVAERFRFSRDLVVEPNVALTLPVPTRVVASRPSPATRTAVFVGRLIPLKGLRLAIAALSAHGGADWVLDVYGDGPEEKPGRDLARRLDVERRVRFHGQRPREDVLAAVADADAMLFPGMHDAAGWAVGEAVALGCPVVCLDRGGPPIIIAAAQGSIAVQADRRVVGRLAAALEACHSHAVPSDRWNADRLPALLAEWYERAACPESVSAQAAPASQVGDAHADD
ncbi:MAG: glycosyltransferase [Actinomycetota bacterium]|nr:glycosyltransferase [Actinomycetota bacterium]